MAISTTIIRREFNTGLYGWINLWLASTTGIGVSASTQNGTTALTSPIVTALTSTAGLNVGQPVSGTGIPAGATILSIDSPTQIHISTNATAAGTVALTFGATPLTITSAASPNSIGVSGPIVVTPYQELPNLGYKCRITTAPVQCKNYALVKIGDAVTG
jgi:hypothetical protein